MTGHYADATIVVAMKSKYSKVRSNVRLRDGLPGFVDAFAEAVMKKANGRVNLGDGALKAEVCAVVGLRVPDPRRFSPKPP